jgi:hypothetical protein
MEEGWFHRGTGERGCGVWPVYALLKHLFLAEQVETGTGKEYVTGDMGVVAAMLADDVPQAVSRGSRRLRNAGIARAEMQNPSGFGGMRLAAALLIPVPYGAAVRKLFTKRRES